METTRHKEKSAHPVSQQQLLARVARGTVTYLRLMSPLLEQRAAVSAVTPVLLMELLWRLKQTGQGMRTGDSASQVGCGVVFGVKSAHFTAKQASPSHRRRGS